MSYSLRILLIDSDALLRRGVSSLLLEEGYEIREAAHVNEALQYLTWPDIVILDIVIALGGNPASKKTESIGFELIQAFKKVNPETGIVLFSAYNQYGQAFLSLLKQGHRGLAYLLKGTTEPDKLLQAIQLAGEGQILLEPEIVFEPELSSEADWLQRGVVLMPSLTRREMEIAAAIAQGLSGQAVASDLNLSLKTIQNHLNRIYHKLELPDDASHSSRKSLLLARIYLAYQKERQKFLPANS